MSRSSWSRSSDLIDSEAEAEDQPTIEQAYTGEMRESSRSGHPRGVLRRGWPDGVRLVRGGWRETAGSHDDLHQLAGSGTDAEAIAQVTRFVGPLLRQSGATLHAVAVNDNWSAPTHVAVHISVAPRSRGMSAADLYRHGADIERLAGAFANGDISAATVGDLLRGGGAHLLVGQPEGNWLDPKAEEYDLSTTRGKISLAQAVARFANAEDGGLIVIGANAKKVPGGETIRKVRGVTPRYSDTAARYRRVLDERLYPPVLGLRVDVTPTEAGRALILVDIPAQGEELKPFLVHGAITADGDTEGSYIEHRATPR